MSLRVERLFGVGTWQVASQVPRRRFGVPPDGPWDTESANLARMLVGLGSVEPVFEVLQGSVELVAGSAGSVAVVGSGGHATVQGQTYPLASRIPVEANDHIAIQAHCAYFAFTAGQMSLAKLDWRPAEPSSLRFLPTESQGNISGVTVSRSFSRAGVRLEGHPPGNKPERPSEPCCVGAIQQTPSGELILIGPDGPTIGGYPKLGTIIEADLCLIPRLKIGHVIELTPVSWDEAREAQSKRLAELESIKLLLNITRSV